MCQKLAKRSVTLPSTILVPVEENACIATLVPRNSAFRIETQDLHLLRPKDSEMLGNTPKRHFGSNGVEWMLRNFYTPK
jgi:hypothetical protein